MLACSHAPMRTRLNALIGGFAILLLSQAVCAPAHAQTKFPTRPVRLLLPFGAGGVADVTMRLLGQKLSEKWGQQVIIENRPGAGGVLAQQALLASPAGRLFDVGDRQRHRDRHDAVQDPPL